MRASICPKSVSMMHPPRSTEESSRTVTDFTFSTIFMKSFTCSEGELEVGKIHADDDVAAALELSERLNDVVDDDVLLVLRDDLYDLLHDEEHEIDDLRLGLLDDLVPLLDGLGDDRMQALHEPLHLGPALLIALLVALGVAPLVGLPLGLCHALLDVGLEIGGLLLRIRNDGRGHVLGVLPDLLRLVILALHLVEGRLSRHPCGSSPPPPARAR